MMIEKKIEEMDLVLPEFRPMKSKNLVRGVQSGHILYLSEVGACGTVNSFNEKWVRI